MLCWHESNLEQISENDLNENFQIIPSKVGRPDRTAIAFFAGVIYCCAPYTLQIVVEWALLSDLWFLILLSIRRRFKCIGHNGEERQK